MTKEQTRRKKNGRCGVKYAWHGSRSSLVGARGLALALGGCQLINYKGLRIHAHAFFMVDALSLRVLTPRPTARTRKWSRALPFT